IATDNWCVVGAEVLWVLMNSVVVTIPVIGIDGIVISYALSGAFLLWLRLQYARSLAGMMLPQWRLVDEATLRRLTSFGAVVVLAQLADYLYAPTDYILIQRLLGKWDAVATY